MPQIHGRWSRVVMMMRLWLVRPGRSPRWRSVGARRRSMGTRRRRGISTRRWGFVVVWRTRRRWVGMGIVVWMVHLVAVNSRHD
uniref:Uncharacterized protein n=1 Tax=Rhizophora mucronata TaxID=61149 RepID=A0A2P2P4Y7_RHIMU